MARVTLKQDWYAPGARYFHRGPAGSVQDIPDDLLPFLPSNALLVGLDGKKTPAVLREPQLSDFDHARKSAERMAWITEQAEKHRAAVAAKRAEDDARVAALGTLELEPVVVEEVPAIEDAPDAVAEPAGRRKPRTGA